ncbi:hypothetical protein SAY86_011802 [Trapa natans]|uniref:Uncharacterized protein n=1 Tax=Trapa natans TaxID=22666 RepID=A0AAN7MAE1_TRANT|nr:hypothetical protein SAY86_011802 [Trapa natans]
MALWNRVGPYDVWVASGLLKGEQMHQVLELKPLVNGKDIMNALQLNAGGPLVREWVCFYIHIDTGPEISPKISFTFSWPSLEQKQTTRALQLANPTGSPEECLDWMREIHQKRVKLERNDVSP